MRKILAYLFLLVILTVACIDPAPESVIVDIDITKTKGAIRALNGGNLGPVCHLKMLDMTEEFMDLNIPVIRTHDVPWFSMPAVDIHTIFKDFRLDPYDENNYDFRQTDDYIASLIATGADIVYRLGESIEHSENKYHINPPEDLEKWAAICSGIIRHYNKGWAQGYHYDIKYWEIWNEPDIRPACWTGTDEEFLDLYKTVAQKIKSEFPEVKVGGPAMAHPIDVQDSISIPTDFTDKFLSMCRDNSIPLDFFTWHMYGDDPVNSGHRPGHVRKMLDAYGFTDTESHMNEWNYIPDNNWNALMMEQGTIRKEAYTKQSGIRGAAFVAQVLMLLQDQPIDVANFYTTTAGLFGIFSEYGERQKAYFALKAFAELLETPKRIALEYDKEDGLVFCAGINEDHSEISVMLSNFHKENRTFQLRFTNSDFMLPSQYELYVIDDSNNMSLVKETLIKGIDEFQIKETMNGPSVFLIKIRSTR